MTRTHSINLLAVIEQWPLKRPVRISNHTFVSVDVVVVTLRRGRFSGRGEAVGLYYNNDTPEKLLAAIEAVRPAIVAGASREDLQRLLPPGGARNALDCAYWSLAAAERRQPVWAIAGCKKPRPLLTTFTCGLDNPEAMALSAREYIGAKAIKLKLAGDEEDAARVRSVRHARPDVWLGVDANQALTPRSFERLLPVLVDTCVALIEQPFQVGCEVNLGDLRSPIPIAADESVQDIRDVERAAKLANVINIKLDKCGGLTEALAMAKMARSLGLDVMVGNMTGTSLSTAAAFVVGQQAQIVDLDGPLFLKRDRDPGVTYRDGLLECPDDIWAKGLCDDAICPGQGTTS
jgi:L-alanine-DL-glutamate epimerase-like enolase superfamily enzyme